jgi:uncharacterized protein YggE
MVEPSTSNIGAGQVIDAAVRAGANRVDGILFFISPDRQEEIRNTLIGDAIANARQRANLAAEALGMAVAGVESATINPIEFPVFRIFSCRSSQRAGSYANSTWAARSLNNSKRRLLH